MTDVDIDNLFADVVVEESPLDLTEDDEVLPDPPENPPADPPADAPTCEVCQTPIPWSGRGRKPRKCADHKTRTAGAARATRKKTPARIDQLRDDLLREMVGFGKSLSAVLPTVGVTTVARADKTASALARIAESNPKVLAALEIATRVVPALDLAETVMSLAIALMVDLGRIPPDSVIAVTTGVSATYHEIHDEVVAPVAPSFSQNGAATPSPAPAFAEVNVPPRFARVER